MCHKMSHCLPQIYDLNQGSIIDNPLWFLGISAVSFFPQDCFNREWYKSGRRLQIQCIILRRYCGFQLIVRPEQNPCDAFCVHCSSLSSLSGWDGVPIGCPVIIHPMQLDSRIAPADVAVGVEVDSSLKVTRCHSESLCQSTTVWHDSIAVLGDVDVALRAFVLMVCVHVVLRHAAVCQWCWH